MCVKPVTAGNYIASWVAVLQLYMLQGLADVLLPAVHWSHFLSENQGQMWAPLGMIRYAQVGSHAKFCRVLIKSHHWCVHWLALPEQKSLGLKYLSINITLLLWLGYLFNLERRMLWETASRALKRSRYTTLVALPLSTDTVIAS